MREWILMVLTVNSSLERMTELIDEKVEELALSPGGDTLSKVETIIRLNDKKISLINLRVMHEKVLKRLDKEEFRLLKGFAFGKPVRALAEESGRSVSATYRRLNRALKKAEGVVIAMGYGESRFKYYLQFPYIKAKIAAIRRRSREA